MVTCMLALPRRFVLGLLFLGLALCLILGWLVYPQGSPSKTALISSDQPKSKDSKHALTPVAPELNPAIPPHASPEMKEFLKNGATLANNMADLRAQLANAPVDKQTVMETFQKQNRALLDRQTQLAKVIAQQHQAQPLPEPPPLRLPPNASPQLQAYLTARDQLMREQMAMMNQYRTADPQARQTAMQQWRQQNANRFAQLQQLAQSLSPTPSSAASGAAKPN